MAVASNRKSSGVAILLSLLVTGLGHVYAGATGRGLAFFVAGVVALFSVFAIVGLVLLPIVWIWAAVDASKTTDRHNLRLLQNPAAAPM